MRVNQISNYSYNQNLKQLHNRKSVQKLNFNGKGTVIGTAAGTGVSVAGAALWVAAVGTVPLLVVPFLAGAVIMGAGAGKALDDAVEADEKKHKRK